MTDWSKNTIHTLDITGYSAEGMGIGRTEGRVVFVPGTIRGEQWRVRLEKVGKTAAWGRGWSCWPHPLSGRPLTVLSMAGAVPASSGI